LIALPLDIPTESSKTNVESYKIDFKKTMFLKNFIHLIKDDHREVKPECNFEDDYKNWVHVLYFYLGSYYTIDEEYNEGAHAFEKSLECCKQANPKPLQYCPLYFEAKAGLGYCLSKIYFERKIGRDTVSILEIIKQGHQNIDNYDQNRDGVESIFKNIRVPETSYWRWNVEDLGRKAKEVFMEYLNEAPSCENKYPNCHYHLAYLYFKEDNIAKAREWKARGEDAEEKRLPFTRNYPVSSKDLLTELDVLPIPDIKKCDFKECPSVEVKTLKNCPCKQVSYCGR